MPSKIILACGIPIPNGDMGLKGDGFGQALGVPDGYRYSTQFGNDFIGGAQMKVWWTMTRRGDANYPYAPRGATRGRCYTVSLKNTAAISATRTMDSPPSAPGYLWGTEALDPFVTTNDYWYVRLRFWWRGWGIAPGASGAWKMQVIGYNNAAESTPTVLCSVALDGVNDWGTGWVLKASNPFKITTATHHIRVQFVCDRGAVSAGFANGSFTDFSVETLGPIDAASGFGGAESTNPTYAAEGNGGTYYQMLRDRQWDGYRVVPSRLSRSSRLPSGAYRLFDPSGGTTKRRFIIPVRLLTRVDCDKLYRLFCVNKGGTTDPGSYYGAAFPLVFSPQSVDDPGFYYVHWEDDKFPLEPDGEFMPATEASMLYKGVINLVEA